MRLSDLHSYQNWCVDIALRTRKLALFVGLGLGKTIIALTVAAIEIGNGNVRKVLIIAPLRVANTVWHNEAKQWSHTRGLSFAIATGSAAERHAALQSDADVTVINNDNTQWLIEHYPRSKWRWDMLVIDESSGYKNPSAKRVKELRKATVDKTRVQKNGRQVLIKSPVTRLLLLSATPVTNGLHGLWSQVSLIDNGRRLGRSFRAFEMTYFYSPPGASRHAKTLPLEGAKERIFERVKDACYVLRAEDYIELPPLIYNDIVVDMPSLVMKQYKSLEREFLLELPDDEEIIATNEGALGNKLLQFANGAVYTGETPLTPKTDRDFAIMHNAKIIALNEIVDAAEGCENLLIAYYYQSDLKRLKQAYPQAVVMDKAGACVEPFNAGKIPILLAHPASAGMGLNLQQGAHTVVFFSLLWHLEAYQQFIGRLYRQGQTHAVTVNHIVCRGTIEAKIARGLRSKAETQNEFLDYLKQTPKEIAA